MKKHPYKQPLLEVAELRQMGMLCTSLGVNNDPLSGTPETPIGGDAPMREFSPGGLYE